MKKLTMRVALVFVMLGALTGCGDDEASRGGSDEGGSDPGATDMPWGGDTCDPAQLEDTGVPAPLEITIRNDTDAPIYILDGCHYPGLDGVSVGGESLDVWFNPPACSQYDRCEERPADCFGAPPATIDAGASLTVTWNGYLFEDEELGPHPCTEECNSRVIGGCHKRFAAPAGSTLVKVDCYVDEGDPFRHAEVAVDLPATAVTIGVGP